MKQVDREDICNNPINHTGFAKAMDGVLQSHIWNNSRDVIAPRMEPVLDALHGRFQYLSFMDRIAEAIKNNLTDDLLKPGYGPGAHCYVASEAYYYYANSADIKPDRKSVV